MICLLTFLVTSILWMFLIWLSLRQATRNLKNNPQAQAAVLTLIFGDKELPIAEEVEQP